SRDWSSDVCSSDLTLHRVCNGGADPGNLEEVLLGFLDALGDRGRHFLGLAVADPDRAVAVSNHHERGEAEPATSLDHLGHPVDGDHPLQVGALLGRRAPAAVPTTLAATVPAAVPAALGRG